MGIREIWTEFSRVISGRTEVVVDNVEQHREAKAVSSVDEPLQSIGPAIRFVYGKESHAVVAPSMIAIEGRYGHQFYMGDTKIAKVFELRDRGIKGTLLGKCSQMEFVDNGAR